MKSVRYSLVFLLLLTLVAVPAALAQDDGSSGEVQSYVVLTSRQNGIPWNVEQDLTRSGAVVTERLPEVGALVVTTDNPDVIRRIRNVQGIVPNVIHTNGEPIAIPDSEALPMGVNPPITGDDDFFFDRQYGHDAVDAQEAWAQGYFGQGVTVAVLDEGFQPDHPDLAPNVIGTYNAIPYQADALDYAAVEDYDNIFGAPDGCQPSIDPTCSDVFYTLNDAFSHGTHVAGTIAAADNAFGTIGVAPQANLLMVKVLSEQLGFGLTEWIVEGIIWATDNGADIINMSLGGGPFDTTDPAFRDYVQIYNRALTYARNRGVLVIASAGNDSFDFASNPTYSVMPAGGVGVVAVASTGAYGWAISPETGGLHPMGLDRPAYMYSNYGNNLVDIAAPGGDYELYLEYLNGLDNSICEIPNPDGSLRAIPCGVLDYVFSTGSFETVGGTTLINWYWSVGTSMAAPHAAGVAALIKSEMPWRRGEGVWATMRQRAAQAQPDIDFISPLGISVDENQYFGNVGRAATDYALPSDYQTCGGQAATLYVSPSGHVVSNEMHINGQLYRGMLQGGNGMDIIVGTAGDDMLRGLNGDDIICGGDGNDMIYGTDGNDILFGEGGDDRVMGGNGLDTVYGGDGVDMVVGGDGDDTVDGGLGDDTMRGDNGIDMMVGGEGNDNMRGGQGDDEMYGGPGDDFISGDDNNDVLYGEDGDDELRGSNGDDELYGGPGDDTLNGGPGNNTLVQD